MDSLLREFQHDPVRIEGFADDGLLCAQGPDPGTVVSIMQNAIRKATDWAPLRGLKFNPRKTECCFFHPGYKKYRYPSLWMGGEELTYSPTIKYLGLTLDHKLSWTPHIKEKCLKAKRLLNITKQTVGREWGLTPNRVMWIHKAIIRPQVTYGSVVWAHSINNSHRKMLDSVQRQSLLSLAHSMRSTPTAGIEAVIGLVPLHLHCHSLALNAAYRLHGAQGWQTMNNPKSHRDHHLAILRGLIPTQHRQPPKPFKINRLERVPPHPTPH